MRYDRNHLLRLLRRMREADASDLLLKVPGRPGMRVDGEFVRMAEEPVLPVDTQNAARSLMTLASTEFPLTTLRDHEFAFGLEGVGRFRAQIYRQRGSLALHIHRMAISVPSIEEVRLGFSDANRLLEGGLTLVGGAGSHRVLAALTDHLNRSSNGHVVVLEERIEFLHRDRRAAVSQREVGIDTDDWESGIRNALRSGADVVILGEMPDVKNANQVLRAAENGQQVVACVPGGSPKQALKNFVRQFGPEREKEIAQRTLGVLTGVVTLGAQGDAEVFFPGSQRGGAAAAV